ncbi:MAG: orotidine-5'-phosphate decarboxylase, partial [Microbacteriaceae bacterium]|nr:orotidine-5'-phosphate decarboxylase [Microbacteriaceae bacterium]
MLAAGPALCLGIDPHAGMLADWGLPDDADGLREFGLLAAEAARDGGAPIVKPQVAFYERHGAAGLAALEDTIAAARAAGLWVIADAKRGDIGSTMTGYADAWLRPGAPLESDALTVSPYLGLDSLAPAIDAARTHGKVLFVLVATSNPEGPDVQLARVGSSRTLAADILDRVRQRNETAGPDASPLGVVIGGSGNGEQIA